MTWRPCPVPLPDLRRRLAAAISVGNWMARKGTLELLDALGRLPDDRVTLTSPAGTTSSRPSPSGSEAASPSSATGSCTGVLDRDSIAPSHAGADVFVLPSWREPYGTVYGEALAAGLPVVGWRAGNLPHLVSDGVEGVVLAPGDVPALAAALDRLARDEPWRAALARAAGRRGAALPRWTDTAAALLAALKELTGSAR